MLRLLIAKSKINNTKINNAQGIDVVMSICNSIDYSKNLSRTSVHQLRMMLMILLTLLEVMAAIRLNLNKK